MAVTSALGEYLRTRRELVRPVEVGLPEGERRRVPGLRREEVALLAGISTEYYLRLEQGRDHHPSGQILDCLAKALRLDTEASAYLHDLARPAPRGRRPERPEQVADGVRNLIANWTTTPAFVHGRTGDVLAANPMAVALSPHFAPGSNTLRAAFLEPEMRVFFRDWDEMTAKVVPYLRSVIGAHADDPRLAGLIEELSLGSERFRTLWARHDVRHKTSGLTWVLHPRVGPLDLRYEKLGLAAAGQMLITYHADPGSKSERRLRLLASPAAP
ncbi:helix-turn-helix transcriptional regulator [Planotetraspora phitsanulokensis]|uniref:Transcriptional regulator n=1 Tax=Planotetraspora phitsanulokensis TaxID=575192 RepID=A0A8J3UAT6_9ACTN|nr:helix-turn-helix transcriptional regulator [Planotetraspora phitsanulokensis]GII41953.1 transcriptional regulator [Planotetraspora phitsanulokensis]